MSNRARSSAFVMFRRPWIHGIAFVIALAVAGRAAADPILDPTNGHYYNVVDGFIAWDQANALAQAQTFMGSHGHLVTITSAQENQFLTNTFGSARLTNHWIGGMIFFPIVDPPVGGPIGPPPVLPTATGSWVTGEPFSYSNWASGAPIFIFADMGRILFDRSTTSDGQAWNGLPGVAAAAGYVVEFDSVVAPPPPPPATTPEPATLTLLGSGFIALAGFGWLRRKMQR